MCIYVSVFSKMRLFQGLHRKLFSLSQPARAAITKHHPRGGPRTDLVSYGSGGRKSETRCQHGWVLVRAPLSGSQTAVFSLCSCGLSSLPPLEGHNPVRLGPTSMTSFHLSCLLNALSSGLGILGVRASTREFTGDTVQFIADSLQSNSFEYRLKIQKKRIIETFTSERTVKNYWRSPSIFREFRRIAAK